METYHCAEQEQEQSSQILTRYEKSYNIGQTVSGTRELWSLGVTVKKPRETVFSLAMKWWARKPGFILLHLPQGSECMPIFLSLSFLSCVYCACHTLACVCVCIGWVCWGIIGLKLCGMEFIKVSGALWWKLCEGISTMTIARVHAKWLVFSCFLMKILCSYFGSQGLNIALTSAVYTVSWIGRCHPLGRAARIRSIQELFSMLRIWPGAYLSAVSLETDSPYSICICSIQFPFGDWLTQCLPIHHNHQIIYLVVIKRQIMEKKINPNLNFVRPEHYNQMLELFVRRKGKNTLM